MRRPPTVASKRRRNQRDRARSEEVRRENGRGNHATPHAARVERQAERVEWALGRIESAREALIANPNDRVFAYALDARREEYRAAKHALAVLSVSA